MTESAPQRIGVHAVARRLGVGPRMVHKLIEDGQLEALRVGGLWRVDVDEVERYITANTRPRAEAAS